MTQAQAIASMERKGWEFQTLISAQDPEHPHHQVAVLTKHPRPGTTHYAEVDPDGTIRE